MRRQNARDAALAEERQRAEQHSKREHYDNALAQLEQPILDFNIDSQDAEDLAIMARIEVAIRLEHASGRGNPVTKVAPPIRPEQPTAAYCLISPKTVRWDGQTELKPQLWRLLQLLLDRDHDIGFDAAEQIMGLDSAPSKTVQNRVSELNSALEKIRWPVTYSSACGRITAS